MHKKIIPKLVAAVMAFGMAMPVGSAFAAPPVYRSNELDDVMITKIVPATSYMEITYTNVKNRVNKPTYFNFIYGSVTDYQLHWLYNGVYNTNKTIYKGSRAMLVPGGIEVGDVIPIAKNNMFYGGNLTENATIGMIDYFVDFMELPQMSRADYRRCVKSSVFVTATMECRMENLGNGRIQYQPYTMDGSRVEIPEAEDAYLTNLTENWRAEPGDWGAEWYQEDSSLDDTGDNDGMNDMDDMNGAGGAGDVEGTGGTGDAGDIGDTGVTGGTGGAEGTGDAGDATGDVPNSETGLVEIAQQLSNLEQLNNIIKEQKGNETTREQLAQLSQHNQSEVSVAESTSEKSSQRDATSSDIRNEMVVAEDQFSDTVQANNDDGILRNSEALLNNDSQEKVGVPNLGKEFNNQPNWTAIAGISIASVAGLVGWLFLFFRKNRLKRRKEEEK